MICTNKKCGWNCSDSKAGCRMLSVFVKDCPNVTFDDLAEAEKVSLKAKQEKKVLLNEKQITGLNKRQKKLIIKALQHDRAKVELSISQNKNWCESYGIEPVPNPKWLEAVKEYKTLERRLGE